MKENNKEAKFLKIVYFDEDVAQDYVDGKVIRTDENEIIKSENTDENTAK